MSRSKKPEALISENSPFRLLDLPHEIQAMIYECHYADSSPTLDGYNEEKGTLKFRGIPNLNLEQACRNVSTHAKSVRNRVMRKDILISDVGEIKEPQLEKFCTLDRYLWLRHHIGSLHLFTENPFPYLDWVQIVDSCPSLEDISMDILPRYIDTEYPEEMSRWELTGYIVDSALKGEFDDLSMEIVDEMGIDSLIEALSLREEYPIVVVNIHVVKVLVDPLIELREPCMELRTQIMCTSDGPCLDLRECRSEYACGISGRGTEEPQIVVYDEPTDANMPLTKMALLQKPTSREEWIAACKDKPYKKGW